MNDCCEGGAVKEEREQVEPPKERQALEREQERAWEQELQTRLQTCYESSK